jgi:hypothetical protein
MLFNKIISTSKHSINGIYALEIKKKANEAGNLPHSPYQISRLSGTRSF